MREVSCIWHTAEVIGYEHISPSRPGVGGVGRRIEEAMELIEMELRHTIAYVNDAVVPQVRRESITAMRGVAETLRNLADRFEQRSNWQAPNVPSGQPQQPPTHRRIREADDMALGDEECPAHGRPWACRCWQSTGCAHHKNVATAPVPNELAPYAQPAYVPRPSRCRLHGFR